MFFNKIHLLARTAGSGGSGGSPFTWILPKVVGWGLGGGRRESPCWEKGAEWGGRRVYADRGGLGLGKVGSHKGHDRLSGQRGGGVVRCGDLSIHKTGQTTHLKLTVLRISVFCLGLWSLQSSLCEFFVFFRVTDNIFVLECIGKRVKYVCSAGCQLEFGIGRLRKWTFQSALGPRDRETENRNNGTPMTHTNTHTHTLNNTWIGPTMYGQHNNGPHNVMGPTN